MSSDEISLNGLNTQLVFQDEALRSFNCHQHQQQQHRVGDPGPKTRGLTGFVDEKIFSVDRDRYFRPQPSIFSEHHDRRDPPPQQGRDWSGNATSPSTDESDGEDDDDGVDDEEEEEDDDVDEGHKSNNHNINSDSTNCNNNNNKNNNTNSSMVTAVVDKMGNGKAKNQSIFGKNGDAMQNVNNGAIVTVAAEADADVYYSSQYLQQVTEGSSGSGQKECVVVDHGCGISGSGDSIRALLSDPVS